MEKSYDFYQRNMRNQPQKTNCTTDIEYFFVNLVNIIHAIMQ